MQNNTPASIFTQVGMGRIFFGDEWEGDEFESPCGALLRTENMGWNLKRFITCAKVAVFVSLSAELSAKLIQLPRVLQW